ncbi:ESPR domain-containing protein [Avibacterium endocarditidis]|uniref:ESPR domain-containing protein n=1 Tax=Avibacterium endocarditidis TaxID=380674 RepID=A0ABX4ZT85_9PAST|nr:hypothetical protein C3Z13_03595 [Avibacterium endocarditidis]
MNKIFRIVWNQSLQTWVVVSELASRHGKPTTVVGSVQKTSKTLKVSFKFPFTQCVACIANSGECVCGI